MNLFGTTRLGRARIVIASVLFSVLCGWSAPFIRAQREAARPGPFLTQQTIWKPLEDGYAIHHVHALAVTNKGTLLAFTEGRLGAYDEDPKHLLLKRSTDKGATWSDDVLIEQSNGAYWRTQGQPGKLEAWTNPAALVDQQTGRIFIFYALGEGSHHQRWTRVFYRYSDNDGLTWLPAGRAGRVEITKLLKENRHGWTFHMPGPGHGLQLGAQRGAHAAKNGRLLMQFWNRRLVTERPRNYGVTVLYSDDHGKTWRRGGETGLDYGMNESRLVELADGQIVVNGRGSDAEDNAQRADTKMARLYAYSNDAGASFSASTPRRELNYTNVDSGMVRYVAGGQDCLLVSHPSAATLRERLVVSVSCDGAKTWTHQRLIDPGRVSYSDLVVLPDQTIGLIYGKRAPGGITPSGLAGSVAFVRFDFAWLIKE